MDGKMTKVINQTAEDNVSVVLVDDHEVVRKGLLAFFNRSSGIKVLAAVGSAQEAIAEVKKHKPQVVLLDLLLPGSDAVSTIHQIREVSPDSQIVILTSYDGDEHIAAVLEAGALSYVLKDIDSEELIVAVKKASTGSSVLDHRLAQALIDDFENGETNLHDRLTKREREVLELIAKGLNNSELAATLFISEITVKTHVSRIMSKLYLTDRTKVAVYAWEKGIINRS